MVVRLFPVIMVSLALAGCGMSAAQRARMEAEEQAKFARLNEADDAQCRNYGASQGSQTYIQCRMMIGQQRRDHEAAERMAEDQRIQENSSAMMAVGAGLMR